MTRRKGTKPEQYAGAFQKYSSIPTRYRLETYEEEYSGRETWSNYRGDVLLEAHDSKTIKKESRLAGDSWRDHMRTRGQHHALATPMDANTWCQKLLDTGRTERYNYECYYLRIYRFYDYLKASFHHPHLYNPLLLAAVNYDAARQLWMYRIKTRPEVVGRDS